MHVQYKCFDCGGVKTHGMGAQQKAAVGFSGLKLRSATVVILTACRRLARRASGASRLLDWF